MVAKAKIKYLKVSPRKLRLLLPLIKNKTVPVALFILENTNKKAASYIYKAVHSAAANAKRLPNINEDDLYISRIFADGGPMLKRYRAQPMGMAAMIRRRTSHLTVELDILKRPVSKEVKKVSKVSKVSAKGLSLPVRQTGTSGRKKDTKAKEKVK